MDCSSGVQPHSENDTTTTSVSQKFGSEFVFRLLGNSRDSLTGNGTGRAGTERAGRLLSSETFRTAKRNYQVALCITRLELCFLHFHLPID
jgi:hypothetical protein